MSGSETPVPQQLYLQCRSQDFNAETQECSDPYWAAGPMLLPPLSEADAWIIAAKIAGLWGIGFLIREARRPTKY